MRRLVHHSLGLASSAAIWTICISAPILLALAVSPVPIVVLVVFEASLGRPIDPANLVAIVLAFSVTALAMPRISMAILRLSVRCSPLPIGTRAAFHMQPTLWLAWLLFVAALAASDAAWLTFGVAAVVALGGLTRIYTFRRRWRGLPEGRTILFLRRFGRTADRMVSTALRRAAPKDACVVFLVGGQPGAASWDPLVVAFDGLSPRALPLYLQSTNDQWIEDVTHLVGQAYAIVIDASDWSASMDTERAIVEQCGALHRVTFLERDDRRAAADISAGERLRYRRSWGQAGQRMFWGFMLALLPAVVADDLGWSREARIFITLPAIAAWALLVVRPLMDAGAAAQLARRLAR